MDQVNESNWNLTEGDYNWRLLNQLLVATC